MRKKINEKDTKLIRVRLRTARLLDGFNRKSYDLAIWFLWDKLCKQGKDIKEIRKRIESLLPASNEGSEKEKDKPDDDKLSNINK
jgi:hypothetical protein